MRRPAGLGLVFLLTVAPVLGAEAGGEKTRTTSADVALGTATLGHGELALGPFWSGAGAFDRVMVGTYVVPWFAGLALEDSIVPNATFKAELYRDERFSVGVASNLFHARLGDVEGDGLKVRALVWPVRGLVEVRWLDRMATRFELTMVYSAITGSHLEESAPGIFGVAFARSLNAGVLQRMRMNDWLSVFGRFRLLVGHAPVVAEVNSEISETLSVNVRARANSAELSSGAAGVAGLHLSWARFALTAGIGYGTWFVPGVYLPVSESMPIGELNFYFRF